MDIVWYEKRLKTITNELISEILWIHDKNDGNKSEHTLC